MDDNKFQNLRQIDLNTEVGNNLAMTAFVSFY